MLDTVIIIAVSASVCTMISFFLGAIFGAVTMTYIKERKNENADD